MDESKLNLDTLANMLKDTSLNDDKGVSFSGKGLKLDKSSDAKEVVDCINKAKTVEFLRLDGNSLGVEAAKEISSALKNRSEFKYALWNDMFTGRLKTEIPLVLKDLGLSLMASSCKLVVLDLSDNASGPIGVEGFEQLLASPTCFTLQELRLNNMGIGVTGAKKLSTVLLNLYNNSKNSGQPLRLKVFIAGRNRLEDEGIIPLANVLQKIGTLEEIVIPQNGIYHGGIQALSQAFKENKSLRVINLNDNSITPKGAIHLQKVLPLLENLSHLDLGDCLLKNEGASSIINAIESHKKLIKLNLGFNELNSDICEIIMKTLTGKESLKMLIMDGNCLGPEGKSRLIELAESGHIPLGSLSEDEGEITEDDEDDNDGGEEEDENEVDCEEDDEECEDDSESGDDSAYLQKDEGDEDEDDEDREDDNGHMNSAVIQSGIITTQPAKPTHIFSFGTMFETSNFRKNPVESFLLKPSPIKFLEINQPRHRTILDNIYMKKSEGGDDLMSAIVKVSGLYSQKTLSDPITECCFELYLALTKWANANSNLHIINNRLPVHLGLIKEEGTNKKLKVENQEACIHVLREAISKKCLPESCCFVINWIIDNVPNKTLQ